MVQPILQLDTGEPNDDKDDGQYASDNVLISNELTPWNTSHIGSWNDNLNDISTYEVYIKFQE